MFSKHSSRYYLSWIIAGSILLKLCIFVLLYCLGSDFMAPDTYSYVKPAVASSFWMSHDLWMRTPLYPLFIKVIYALFDKSPYTVVLIQVLLSGLIVFNGYRITKQLSNEKLALFAACLLSINYLFIAYANLMLSDLLFAILMSYIFYYAVRFMRGNQSTKVILTIGMLMALATLTRPISYYLTILLAIALMCYLPNKKGVLCALVMLAPSLVLVGGWQLRNKMVLNTYQYSNIDAVNLYRYYAPDIVSRVEDISFLEAREKLNEMANRFTLTETERYNYYRHEGFKIILSHPVLAMRQALEGLVKTIFGNDYMLLFYNSEQFKYGKDLESKLFRYQLERLTVHDWLKLSTIGIFFAFNLLIVILGIYYIYTALIRSPQHRAVIVILLLIIGYFLLVSSNYCSQARFRVPFEVLINCFAALGACRIMARYGHGLKYDTSRL